MLDMVSIELLRLVACNEFRYMLLILGPSVHGRYESLALTGPLEIHSVATGPFP